MLTIICPKSFISTNDKRPNNLSLPIPQNYVFTNDFIHDNSPDNTAHNTEKNLVTGNINFIENNDVHIQSGDSFEPDGPVNEAQSPVPEEQLNTTLKRSTRQRKMPMYLHDFHTSSIHTNHVSTNYPVYNFVSYKSLSTDFKKFVFVVSSHMEPQSYAEASKHPCWQQAMKEELDALETNHTWITTSLPLGKTTIGCRWIYKIKRKSDGTIERYKVRLVAKGYTQLEGLDFLETFAPVAKLTTLRLLLALAATQNWVLKQLDVNNAFLHGDLVETAYMKPPPGLLFLNSTHVCKLQQSLYGLREAGKQWYAKLSNFLLSHNYILSTADNSTFLKHHGTNTTALLVYVDDIVLTGNDAEKISCITNMLDQQFKIKNLRDLTFFLGLEVACNSTGIHLCQRKYTLDLLHDVGMLDYAPMPTPMIHSSRLSPSQGAPRHKCFSLLPPHRSSPPSHKHKT